MPKEYTAAYQYSISYCIMQAVKIYLFEFGLEVDKRQNHGGLVEKFNPALKRSAARRNNPASSPWVAVRGGGACVPGRLSSTNPPVSGQGWIPFAETLKHLANSGFQYIIKFSKSKVSMF